jgi:hypothetical protein
MKLKFKIRGKVIERESKRPLAGLMVRAYDKDLLFDDLLATTTTDKTGSFEMRYSGSDFQELFDRNPDIYFIIMDETGARTIHTTAESVRCNAGADEFFEIEIPSHKIPPSDKNDEITLLDAQGNHRAEFEAGEVVMVNLQGLKPNQQHQVRVLDEKGKKILSASLLSNRFGVIAPTVVWPDMGLGNPEKGGRFAFESFEEAHKVMSGLELSMEILEGKKIIRKSKFKVADKLTGIRLYSATKSGTMQRGLLLGRDELRIAGTNFPPGSLLNIYLVKRRLGWKAGDPIVPVQNPDGSEVVKTIHLKEEDTDFNILVWSQEQLQLGSYDMIARVVLPHEYRKDERTIRASDIISDRYITSVVIRDDIYHYKPIEMGCIMASKEIAGKMLWGVPEEILYTNNFPKGTDVWAALDPAGLMSGEIGKKIRYYVIQHKEPADWTASSLLTPIPGTGAEIITSSSCVNANAALVWSNPMQAGKYDLVVDFGNNAPNPADFIADDSFDPPMDMIDGYMNVGFYVTDDPSIPGTFAVGQTTFNEPAVTIPAIGVWIPTSIQPDGILGDTLSGTLDLPLIAEVRYPADINGLNVDVSPAKSNYPVVVIMHGQHTTADPSYQGYTYLLDHLASQGFIALSIDCNVINAIAGGGGAQDTRGHAILEHLALLDSKNTNPGLFQGKIDMTNIGIMGHSRGGDGVVQAEIFNQTLGLGWNIRAIVALAPTDFSGTSPSPLNLTTSKFLCIYGSNDGDVWGSSNPSTQYTSTGFRFYDRATIEKSFVFIYGATHNRFNTEWGTESKVDTTSPKILSATQHENLLKGYMTAFMQVHLQGRTEQNDYFTGELKIPSVSSVDVHTQYRPPSNLTLDDFETEPALDTNSLTGNVTYADLDGLPEEDVMGTIDPHSPHQTRGLRLKWNALTATYQSEIPLVGTQRNVSTRKFLSFRVTQKVAPSPNPVDQVQDLRVRLTTAGGGNSRAIRAGYFASIPYPYKPEYIASRDANEGPNTKAAMKTVRIPLYAWTTKCLSIPMVDLTNVESVTFEFSHNPTGELEFDDIEFTD